MLALGVGDGPPPGGDAPIPLPPDTPLLTHEPDILPGGVGSVPSDAGTLPGGGGGGGGGGDGGGGTGGEPFIPPPTPPAPTEGPVNVPVNFPGKG